MSVELATPAARSATDSRRRPISVPCSRPRHRVHGAGDRCAFAAAATCPQPGDFVVRPALKSLVRGHARRHRLGDVLLRLVSVELLLELCTPLPGRVDNGSNGFPLLHSPRGVRRALPTLPHTAYQRSRLPRRALCCPRHALDLLAHVLLAQVGGNALHLPRGAVGVLAHRPAIPRAELPARVPQRLRGASHDVGEAVDMPLQLLRAPPRRGAAGCDSAAHRHPRPRRETQAPHVLPARAAPRVRRCQ